MPINQQHSSNESEPKASTSALTTNSAGSDPTLTEQYSGSETTNPSVFEPERFHPFIDLNRLNELPRDAVQHVLLDLRIKKSRINVEIAELKKLIENAAAEINVLIAKRRFYQSITSDLTTFLGEHKSWQKSEKDTPPAKNS